MPPSSGGGWRVRGRLQRTSICTLLLKGPPPEHMRKSLRFTSTITHERGTYERTRKSKTRYCLVKSGLTGRTSDCYTDCAAHFIAPLAKSSSGYWSDKRRIRKGHCFRSFSQPRSGLSGWAISGTEGAGRL